MEFEFWGQSSKNQIKCICKHHNFNDPFVNDDSVNYWCGKCTKPLESHTIACSKWEIGGVGPRGSNSTSVVCFMFCVPWFVLVWWALSNIASLVYDNLLYLIVFSKYFVCSSLHWGMSFTCEFILNIKHINHYDEPKHK